MITSNELQKSPDKFIQIDLPEHVENRMEDWDKSGRKYGIFPIKGDSMTCSGSQSIPEGAMVVAAELKLQDIYYLETSEVPVRKPVLIILRTPSGKEYSMCKSIHTIDFVFKNYKLHSFNPKYNDFWVPMRTVTAIWEVIYTIK